MAIRKEKFDKIHWENNLKHIDWYIRLSKELQMLLKGGYKKEEEERVYNLVHRMLIKNRIPLAKKGTNLDKERKSVDTIIIHHTVRKIVTPEVLSAVGFLRQYGLVYLNNYVGYEKYATPVWSGHFFGKKQVFYSYHWLILPNGESPRLLKDSYIGWHVGNWDTNRRSVGIALSGNFDKNNPSTEQMKALIKIIDRYYPQISKRRIFGHNQIVNNTVCPGEKFTKRWKRESENLL